MTNSGHFQTAVLPNWPQRQNLIFTLSFTLEDDPEDLYEQGHTEKIPTVKMLQYICCSHLNSLLMCSIEQKAAGFSALFHYIYVYSTATAEEKKRKGQGNADSQPAKRCTYVRGNLHVI